MKRTGMLSVLLCILVLLATGAYCQYPSYGALPAVTTESILDKKISADIKDQTVKEALEKIFREVGTHYVIDQNIGDEALPSVRFVNVSLRTALDTLARSAGLVYRIDDELISISKKPQTGVIEEPKTQSGDQRVSLEAKRQKLPLTLDYLFSIMKVNYILPEEARDISIDLSFQQLSPYNAVQKVIETAGLKATPTAIGPLLENTVIKLELQPWWTKPIRLDFTKVNTNTALTNLFGLAGKDQGLQIQPGVPNAELDLRTKDIPFIQALNEFAKVASISYSISPSGFVIYPARTEDKLVNLEVKDTPLSEVIEILFAGTDASYTVDPTISALKVTAKLRNVDFATALKTVTRTAGLVYRVDGQTYAISPKSSADQMISTPTYTALGSQSPDAATAKPSVTEVVTLKQKQISSGDIASVISKPGKVSVTTVGPDKLIITGSREDVDEALKLVRALDADEALPKSIRIKLDIKVNAVGLANPTFFNTEGVGMEGTEIPLGMNLTKSSVNGFGLRGDLQCNITPQLTEDGRINLSGKSEIYLGTAIMKPGATQRDEMMLTKSFTVFVAVPQGKPTVIAAGSTSSGTDNTGIEITATAVVE